MSEVNSMPHDEFSKHFMESVEESYEEWKESSGASYPDFEEAIERARREGVAPTSR